MMENNYVNGKQGMYITQRVQANVLKTVGLAAATLLFAVVTALFAGSHAFAQTQTNTANTLKVTPVRSDIEIKPGENKTVQVTVSNLTDAPITVHPVENDFVAGDERGTPALILDEDKYAPTRSLKRFMSPLTDVTIPAGEAKTIDVLITVPKDAQAGGYFGAVRFAPVSPDGGGQVNLSASVASLILLKVPGNIIEKLNLTNFDIQQNGTSGSYFNTPDNLQASVRFENKGGLQAGPFGKLSVKKDDKVVYETDFNNANPRDMILPDSARRWDIPLDKIEKFGHYTVNATFTYGAKNQTIEVNKSFWVIPMAYIIAAIVALVILLILIGVGIWLLVRNYKKRQLRGGHSQGRGSSRR